MTQRLEAALRRRYEESSPGEWLLLSEVFLGDGHVDFVAVNLWRARGNRILGFEVKGSRGDWLAELRKPGKSEAGIHACDEWWLVAPRGLVRPDELPDGWGVLELRRTRLVCAVPAASRTGQLSRQLLVSLLRRVQAENIAERLREYENGVAVGREWRKRTSVGRGL